MGIENPTQSKGPILAMMDLEDIKEAPPKKKTENLEKLHGQLMDWYQTEIDKQSINRYQQQIDCDYYDSMQYTEEEALEMMQRGQQPAVYNQVAPMVDWVIGTERRTRVDWKVLPREEGDLQAADIKTKLLKHVSDVNRVPFVRSKAFADACKAGVGWIEHGITTDPTKEMIYERHEDWRNMWWDSNSVELDLDDCRFIFRKKWLDTDISIAMFPESAAELKAQTIQHSQTAYDDMDDNYYLGQPVTADHGEMYTRYNRHMHSSSTTSMGRRDRVQVIEFWFKRPEACMVCHGEVYNGQIYDMKHPGMRRAMEQGVINVVRHVKMRMYVAFMTKKQILKVMPSPYAHNRFPFTPIWAYRRTRDNLPYGVIRRVRDPQDSLNKRQSKAIWHLSARQVIADDDAVEDWDELAEEVARPDGIIKKKRNAELNIEPGTQHAAAHLEFASMDSQFIQKSAGITDENMGRRTNATSGIAIEARQQQGAVVTTELFDNLLLCTQLSGEIVLSLTEQYYTMPKVVRIIGTMGKQEFIKINEPKLDENGQVTYINDIAANQADFIVSDQDFNGSLRQAMFESMVEIVKNTQIDPMLSLKLLRMAFEHSDLPNKDEIVQELRKMTGDVDTSKPLSPEEQAMQEAAKHQQEQQQQVANQAQQLANEELQAKVDYTRAQAEKLRMETERLRTEGMGQDTSAMDEQIAALKEQTAQVVNSMNEENEALKAELANIRQELANRKDEIEVKRFEAAEKANAEIEVARINAAASKEAERATMEAQAKVREIESRIEQANAASEAKINALMEQVAAQNKLIEKQMASLEKTVTQKAAEQPKTEKPEPAQPININVQVDAKTPSKTLKIERDKDGNLIGGKIEGDDK